MLRRHRTTRSLGYSYKQFEQHFETIKIYQLQNIGTHFEINLQVVLDFAFVYKNIIG